MPSTIDLDQSASRGSIAGGMPTFALAGLLDGGDRCAAEIARACRETGFFAVTLDAATSAAIAHLQGHMADFFDLPDDHDVKRSAYRDGKSGWIPRYTEPAYQPNTVSALEAFDVRQPMVRDAGSWPAIDGFHDAAERCWRCLLAAGDAVLARLAEGAGLDPCALVSRCGSRTLNTMRLLHYAREPDNPARNLVGISAHTDFECVTLLHQSAPGLELFTADNQWVDAPTGDDCVVVLLGDMVERWTNGWYRATGHRVRHVGHRRFSIVMFMAADESVLVQPLDRFVTADRPAAYRPVTQAAHIEAEVARARANAGPDSV